MRGWSWRREPERSRGQALVELAIIMPLIALLLLGILDLSRVFTSVLAVESAAREAADYGALRSDQWSDANRPGTLAGMEVRACLATSNLPDYVEDATTCQNPTMQVDLIDENEQPALDKNGKLTTDCDNAARSSGEPCKVKVDLTYTFDLIIPLGFEFAGVYYGLPQDITFTRSSVFAISDFSIDRPINQP